MLVFGQEDAHRGIVAVRAAPSALRAGPAGPHWFGPGGRSAWREGGYVRHHAAAHTCIAARAGRLLVLGPDFGPDVVDLGSLAPWPWQARDAGF
jgi:hypothetical protein